MSSIPGKVKLSDAEEELQTQFHRLRSVISGKMLWDQVLTQPQRDQLDGDFEKCFAEHGTIGMWRQLHPVSEERATIEVARAIRTMDEVRFAWILRKLGEQPPAEEPQNVPTWDSQVGELRWNGVFERRVRVMAKASNIQKILDAFQAAGWPRSVKNPLSTVPDQQQVHLALRSLNQGLTHLCFRSSEGGNAIFWEVR